MRRSPYQEDEKRDQIRVNRTKFCVPKATKVETAVIMMERSREPCRRWVHMLEAPPPGQQPPRNMPRRISRSSKVLPGYRARPTP